MASVESRKLIDRLLRRNLAFSTIACKDEVSIPSLLNSKYLFWMVGNQLDAGDVVAVYVPKCARHPKSKLPIEERGRIRYLFSTARSTYRPSSKKFSTSRSKNVAFLFHRVRLENGITLQQLKNSKLKGIANKFWRIGRVTDRPTKTEVRTFWKMVLDNNPSALSKIRSSLLSNHSLPVYEPPKSYRYDIALSCASEDSDIADDFYRECRFVGIRAYYYRSGIVDNNNSAQTAQSRKKGVEIYRSMANIYKKQALFFVPILSKNYGKTWAERELAFFQERCMSSYEYMIPIRLDKSSIQGLEGDIRYYDLDRRKKKAEISRLVAKIKEKLLREKK